MKRNSTEILCRVIYNCRKYKEKRRLTPLFVFCYFFFFITNVNPAIPPIKAVIPENNFIFDTKLFFFNSVFLEVVLFEDLSSELFEDTAVSLSFVVFVEVSFSVDEAIGCVYV